MPAKKQTMTEAGQPVCDVCGLPYDGTFEGHAIGATHQAAALQAASADQGEDASPAAQAADLSSEEGDSSPA